MVEDITPDETLDCRGLSCPMPVLKTKEAIGKMQYGWKARSFCELRQTPG